MALAKRPLLRHDFGVHVPAAPLSRRVLLTGALAGAALASANADGRPRRLPVLPLSLSVASYQGKPVVDDAWLRRQVARAQQLMAPHGLRLGLAAQHPIAASHAELETADDRDALAALLQPSVINAFIVRSLRDVDDPKLQRMGVRWRLRRDVSKDYVIVTASAMPSTLCHELGHYFGNGHSQVMNNVMSYRRDDPAAVRFDSQQGARMRQVAWTLLARRKLTAIPEPAHKTEDGPPGKT